MVYEVCCVDGEAAEAEEEEAEEDVEEEAEAAGWSKKNKKPHGKVGKTQCFVQILIFKSHP